MPDRPRARPAAAEAPFEPVAAENELAAARCVRGVGATAPTARSAPAFRRGDGLR